MKNIVFYAAMFFSSCLLAQPSTLDNTFDIDGWQTSTILSTSNIAYDVLVQPDGKIVVAGYTGNDVSAYDAALIRYNIDGSLDNTFSMDGKVTTHVSADDIVYSIALQPDGKIVAAGGYTGFPSDGFFLIRYNSNGTLDNSFGTGGIIDGFPGGILTAVAIQPDGKTIASGCVGQKYYVARYNEDGTSDFAFNFGGSASLTIGNSNDDSANCMALLPDGKIILAGHSVIDGQKDLSLACYNPDGTLYTGFSIDGKVTYDFGSDTESISAIAIQPDGKIIISVRNSYPSDDDFVLKRLNTDGSLDNTFGSNGFVNTDINNNSDDDVSDILLQPDGKILAGGSTFTDFAFTRYTSNGIIDSTFGTNGIVKAQFSSNNIQCNAIALQPDGKIVATGKSIGTNKGFVTARILTGLTIGIINFSIASQTLVYPNPLGENETIEYTLTSNENITINLIDSQGKLVKTFVENTPQKAGNYKLALAIPTNLAQGVYFVKIQSPNGSVSIRVIK